MLMMMVGHDDHDDDDHDDDDDDDDDDHDHDHDHDDHDDHGKDLFLNFPIKAEESEGDKNLHRDNYNQA